MSKWECKGKRLFNESIVITDPCYLGYRDPDDEVLRRNGLASITYYGDWGCTVYKTARRVGDVRRGSRKLGTFTADAGMVCVIGLKTAKALKPGFMDWLKEHSWCATVIPNFEGEVRLMTKHEVEVLDDGKEYGFTELHVRGDGNIDGEEASFESVQTSL